MLCECERYGVVLSVVEQTLEQLGAYSKHCHLRSTARARLIISLQLRSHCSAVETRPIEKPALAVGSKACPTVHRYLLLPDGPDTYLPDTSFLISCVLVWCNVGCSCFSTEKD